MDSINISPTLSRPKSLLGSTESDVLVELRYMITLKNMKAMDTLPPKKYSLNLFVIFTRIYTLNLAIVTASHELYYSELGENHHFLLIIIMQSFGIVSTIKRIVREHLDNFIYTQEKVMDTLFEIFIVKEFVS